MDDMTSMNDRYILDADGNPVPEPDLIRWGRWLERADRRVAWTEIDDAQVSTVFLSLDHNYTPEADHRPLLYETMIFWPGHNLDQEMDRYSTRDEALAGHEAMVASVRAAGNEATR